MACDDRFVRCLGAFPALVAVHCEIAAGYGHDTANAHALKLILDESNMIAGGGRRGIAAISERVDIDTLHASQRRNSYQGDEVITVTVDTAVANETEQM